jgi:hypothetical protein
MSVDNACQVRNAHQLLRAAFFAKYEDFVGHHNQNTSYEFSYCLSDGEAVDWLHQLMLGDVVIDLYFDDRANTYSPALGAY